MQSRSAYLSAALSTTGIALGTAAAFAAAVAPAGAATKDRTSCDRLPGRTLAANDRVRVVRATAKGSETQIRACSYRTNRAADLGFQDETSAQGGLPTTFTWAINGDYVAVSASDPGSDEPTDRSAGLSTESLIIWNGRTRRKIKPSIPTFGLRFTELVISSAGSVAAIGNPYRFSPSADGANAPLTESYVRVFEPTAARNPGSVSWRTVAAAPTKTLSGLAISANRLVWSDGSGLQQAPLL
ncbi:MAG: hypothetical protein Q7T55_02390 [Solirubrobacteraceae bacterium]|nr:hypothetical protein [Solirubrobacteraceae bacterium]